ncbi:unnamed protein product [Parascedosporium putredinis]|uniref:Uncharacterized protein n=1 Tax=Parascedosporium putredinis TaxID=1442378 RepID=A0A9P1M8D3_9PEZI|nr:unnamed protein product [Parascedosporium putredinis]CAI7989930.1 unnamed protein product [Parascedosporium putredinis]
MVSSYVAGDLHLEEGTNRLMTGAYYLFTTSSAKIVYTTNNVNYIFSTHAYISCTSPVRVGVPLQCTAENTNRSQFRIPGSLTATFRPLSLTAPGDVGNEIPMDLIPAVPE